MKQVRQSARKMKIKNRQSCYCFVLFFLKKIEIEISGNESAINQQISLFYWGHKKISFMFS